MCNKYCCFPRTCFTQVFKYHLLGARINSGHGIVKNQYRCILKQCACNGNSLFLPARYSHAAFAEDGVVSVFKLNNIIVNIRKLRRPFNGGFVRFIECKGDIVCDRVREKEIVLRNIRTVFAKGMQRNAVYIVSVNKERSVRNIVYAQDKVNQRCLCRRFRRVRS